MRTGCSRLCPWHMRSMSSWPCPPMDGGRQFMDEWTVCTCGISRNSSRLDKHLKKLYRILDSPDSLLMADTCSDVTRPLPNYRLGRFPADVWPGICRRFYEE